MRSIDCSQIQARAPRLAGGLWLIGVLLSPQALGETIAFTPFVNAPAVLTQIQDMANETANVPAEPSTPWLTVAARNVGVTGFEFALERSEVAAGTVAREERVGYLAIEPTDGSFIDEDGRAIRYVALRTGNAVEGWNNGCSTINFETPFRSTPVALAALTSRRGDNGGWLRRCSLSGTTIGLRVDEDVASDSERSHVAESAAIVAFERAFVANIGSGQQAWQLLADSVTLVDTLRYTPEFTSVRFSQVFAEPPIVFALPTHQGSDPAAIRIRDVTTTGFAMAQVEPTGNDGPHISMDVHYLAITPGRHQFADGTVIQAGVVATDALQGGAGINNANAWASVGFGELGPGNLPPTARFSFTPSAGDSPLDVQFDAGASTDDNAITLYTWDFGDGSSASSPDAVRVTHRYSDAGTYRARLRVTDAAGLSDLSEGTITVRPADPGDAPPSARFSMSTDAGDAPLRVDFDASGSTDDNQIQQYAWDYGDGQLGSGINSSHVYTQAGSYTVRLTVTDDADQSNSTTRQVDVRAPDPTTITDAEAARFLTQATFGPTTESIAELQRLGYDAWLNRQFGLQSEPQLDWVQRFYNSSHPYGRHESWWRQVIDGDDQLRQRVAFALSQFLVISDIGYTLSNSQYGVTNYYDMLREGAFGNYRDLLQNVTLNPVMGLFLSMVQNERANAARNIRPDENYAREVMQLFSIGIHELNLDGTIRRDAAGQGIPTYDQALVEEFARVFTGWHFAGVDYWERQFFGQDRINPMEPWEEFHDNGAKTLLNGVVTPAGLGAAEDLTRALDNIFEHDNVAPFISRQLIQRLVTSNPTPAYVRRVATRFNDNGAGVRGDLRAVVRAILMDPEARNGHLDVPNFGKLREPVLRLTHLFRAFDLQPGAQSQHGEYNTASPNLALVDADLGQAVLKAPSVFNFYHPDFSPVGVIRDSNLIAPEFEIATENNVVATTSRISRQIQYYFHASDANARNQSTLDLRDEFALAADVDALLDHLDILLTNGSMSAEMRTILASHLNAMANDEQGRSQRARDAITLIMASPEYLIQR